MGRRKTIDRNTLLDIAEKIVSEQGARALTIEALANAAGITKGGVQYSFRSKEVLIDAMFERWDAAYHRILSQLTGGNPAPLTRVAGHIEATRLTDDTSNARAASLMTALLQSPEQLASTRRWYRSVIDGLDTSDKQGRRARLAFLATEGAFVLRFFGLMDISQEEWQDMLKDAAALLQD